MNYECQPTWPSTGPKEYRIIRVEKARHVATCYDEVSAKLVTDALNDAPVYHAALTKIAERTGSDDPCIEYVRLARVALDGN